MRRVVDFLVGNRPELRLIILALAAIIYLLILIFWELKEIDSSIPYIESCGYSGDPCEVKIVRGY